MLLAGGTGYLGSYILGELVKNGMDTKVLVKNENKIDASLKEKTNLKITHAEITKSNSISGICKGVDVVISTVGITKQKDKLTYS